MNDEACFFMINLETKPISILGPYQLLELKNVMTAGRFSWANLVFNRQNATWMRLFEMKELSECMTALPEPERLKVYAKMCVDSTQQRVNPEQKPDVSADEVRLVLKDEENENPVLPPLVVPVYIQVSGSEFGPLSLAEFKSFLMKQQFKDTIYVWYTGLKAWFPIEEIPLTQEMRDENLIQLKKARAGASLLKLLQGREMRNARRRSLIATIFTNDANNRRETLGVCADISEAGIQIWLEKKISINLEDSLILEIIPISTARIGPIKVKAVMKWYDSVELRAGFQFEGKNVDQPSFQRLIDYIRKEQV